MKDGDIISPLKPSISDFTNVTTFNGWNIVPIPPSPGFRSVEFSIYDSNSQSTSPFTQQTQIQSWPGADWWEGTVTLPPMTRAQAAQWIAFLMALRGTLNCFRIGDPLMVTPQGIPQGTPVVSGGGNNAMTSVLTTRGWKPSVQRHLLPCDYIQVGNRMHGLLNTIASDGSGNATLQIYPSLRETPADGTPIITHGATGLFRLATNKRTWSVSDSRLYGMSFQIKEAR